MKTRLVLNSGLPSPQSSQAAVKTQPGDGGVIASLHSSQIRRKNANLVLPLGSICLNAIFPTNVLAARRKNASGVATTFHLAEVYETITVYKTMISDLAVYLTRGLVIVSLVHVARMYTTHVKLN